MMNKASSSGKKVAGATHQECEMQSSDDELPAKNRSGCFWPLFAVTWLSFKGLLIAVGIAAGVLWPLWSAFHPLKPLVISRETTLITEPLAEDGLPDYARFVLDRQREGVTPENNGAIPFWQAMGPSNVDQEYHEILFDEIGSPIPSEEGSLEKLSDDMTLSRVGVWLADEWGDGKIDEGVRMDLADELIADMRRHPWGDVTPAPLVAWLEENQTALDLLVEAAHKPKFYSPSPNLLTDPPASLLEALLPAVQEIRSACRGLLLRAMFRVEKEDYEGAWHDLEATFLLSDHAAKKEDLVSQMVRIACRDLGYGTLNVWLQENKDFVQAKLVLNYLQQEPEPFVLPAVYEHGESSQILDALLREFSPTRMAQDNDVGKGYFIDINAMFRFVRNWQDRLIDIASEKDRAKRRRRIAVFDDDLEAMGEDFGRLPELIGFAYSRQKRGEMVASIFVSLMMPITSSIIEAEDRSVDELRLARTAAALAVWRLEQGDYPDRLKQLVPSLLPELPQDASWGKPFHYERRGEGYLLYAVGTDGEDNGGDNRRGSIIDGEWILDEESEAVSDGVDLVIRLPIPELRLPAPPTQR